MELKELKQPDDLVASDKPLAIEEDILLPKTGNNLIENYIATIAVYKVLEAMYRMTLDSTSNIHLYPIIFYFDPTTLSISGWFFTWSCLICWPGSLEEWYPAPFDICGGSLKAPILARVSSSGQDPSGLLTPNSLLDIWHSHPEVWPWGFTLPTELWPGGKDQVWKKDLSFFRVFLSTCPMPSFFSMKQESPFPSIDDNHTGFQHDPSICLASCRTAALAMEKWCGTKLVTIIQVQEGDNKPIEDSDSELDSDLQKVSKFQNILSDVMRTIHVGSCCWFLKWWMYSNTSGVSVAKAKNTLALQIFWADNGSIRKMCRSSFMSSSFRSHLLASLSLGWLLCNWFYYWMRNQKWNFWYHAPKVTYLWETVSNMAWAIASSGFGTDDQRDIWPETGLVIVLRVGIFWG